MEKKEIEEILSQSKSNDPDTYAMFKGKAFMYVEKLAAALEAAQREAAWLREAYSKLMDNALGCENCYEDAQALARTKKKE